ncbi:hypothetical protein B296_00034629 [Ensete ventricosum]|uniref:Uncharacterized protein n=1 Tax=Ensete ventricosum TaxID=4639 RepID=A0A426YXC6_ENSVE|nr:hypothetical protein B296_00034629 [Ensete ventricosum]
MIEPIEESKEEDPKPKEDTKDLQPVVSMVHAFAGYTNPQTMKIEGFLEQQLVIILIDTGSTKNFMNSKVAARLMLQKEDCSGFNVKVANDRILKYNYKEDDSAQIRPPDILTDEEAQFQLKIAWDRKIAMRHCLDTTADAGPQEHDAPTIGATSEPHEEL